jgi:arsenate reductase
MTFSTDTTILLHNPSCSKSRAAKAMLEARGVAFEERRYLEQPLDQSELEDLRRLLDRPVVEWTRTKQAEYAGQGLTREAGDEAHLEAIQREPILMERPVLIHAGQAAIGRPLENFEVLLEG